MNEKEIRGKGFEFFKNKGRFPTKIVINRAQLDILMASEDAIGKLYMTKDKTYYCEFEVIIDNNIKEFEVK